MGYVFKVRLASFFTGAALASFAGLYILHNDYNRAIDSLSNQMKKLHDSLDGRITCLEKSKVEEPPVHVEPTE